MSEGEFEVLLRRWCALKGWVRRFRRHAKLETRPTTDSIDTPSRASTPASTLSSEALRRRPLLDPLSSSPGLAWLHSLLNMADRRASLDSSPSSSQSEGSSSSESEAMAMSKSDKKALQSEYVFRARRHTLRRFSLCGPANLSEALPHFLLWRHAALSFFFPSSRPTPFRRLLFAPVLIY